MTTPAPTPKPQTAPQPAAPALDADLASTVNKFMSEMREENRRLRTEISSLKAEIKDKRYLTVKEAAMEVDGQVKATATPRDFERMGDKEGGCVDRFLISAAKSTLQGDHQALLESLGCLLHTLGRRDLINTTRLGASMAKCIVGGVDGVPPPASS